MSAQPWMKFYPADWRADPALRSCSLSARGLWMEMLAIMHEAEPRGHLLINGRAVEGRQLASLSGATLNEVENLLAELEGAGVFSRKKNGVIFSRRMEKDENRTRKLRENGRKGGNPSLCNITDNEALVIQGVKAQKPEARSQKERETVVSPKKANRASRVDGYEPDLMAATEMGLSAERAKDQAARFLDYWRGKAGRDGTKLDWPATWRNWVRSHLDRYGSSNVVPMGRPRDLRDIKDPVERARYQSF